jgi:DNA-binding transcriptional regulator YhcF (GntR family)
MQESPRLGRPPDRRNEIFAALLQRIVKGEILPGQRLPTRREICREFDASPATAQSVLTSLNEAGFTEARGSQGTFVHESPPHLHRYAVVCFQTDDSDTRFYSILRDEAIRMRREGWSFEIIDMPRAPVRDMSMVAHLEERVMKHQFAGLIFTQAPNHLLDTAMVENPDVPCVSLTHDTFRTPHFYGVSVNGDFLPRAIERIKSWGKKRIGVFMHVHYPFELNRTISAIRSAGMETDELWVHGIHFSSPFECRSILGLIFALPEEKRPEVILVLDDNFTEAVTLGVKDFAPTEDSVRVISHVNYPVLPRVHVPVTWLGYDSRDLFLRAVSLIENDRNRIANPVRRVTVDCRFEEELPPGRLR